MKDLAASIRDGRYNEQSFRLNECSVHNHNIIYLIEGDLDTYVPGRSKITKDALISSFVTLQFYKGFSLYRTKSVIESAIWLHQFANKLNKKGGKGHFEIIHGDDEQKSTPGPSYSEVIKRSKKECVNTQNIGEIMLSQIPNVSVAVATQIMNKYGNIMSLGEAMRINPDILEDITVEGKTGKSRRISKIARGNIYRYLIGEAHIPTCSSMAS